MSGFWNSDSKRALAGETPSQTGVVFLRSWRTVGKPLDTKDRPQVSRMHNFVRNYNNERIWNAFQEAEKEEKEKSGKTNCERGVLKVIAKHVISQLVGKCYCSQYEKHGKDVVFNKLGIGTEETWHGYLDMVAVPDFKKCATVVMAGDNGKTLEAYQTAAKRRKMDSNESTETSDDDDDDNGSQSRVEIKAHKIEIKNICQVIGQTVCFSFVQKNKHINDSFRSVPGILMTQTHFTIVIYDPETDILLVSEKIRWMDDKQPGIQWCILLWATLHYTLYLNAWDPRSPARQCGFLREAEQQGTLPIYQKLDSFTKENVSFPRSVSRQMNIWHETSYVTPARPNLV